MPSFQPFREPARTTTLLRTGAVAIVVGGVIVRFSGGLARWPVWFVVGMALMLAMELTATLLDRSRPTDWPALWLGVRAFIDVELVAHLALRLRRRPNVYDGRG